MSGQGPWGTTGSGKVCLVKDGVLMAELDDWVAADGLARALNERLQAAEMLATLERMKSMGQQVAHGWAPHMGKWWCQCGASPVVFADTAPDAVAVCWRKGAKVE